MVVLHDSSQKALIAYDMSKEVRKIDVSCSCSGDVLIDIVIDFELVQAEGERIHESCLEKLEGESDNRPQVVVGVASQQSLEVLNAKLKEIPNI
jgi:hypothetical protein